MEGKDRLIFLSTVDHFGCSLSVLSFMPISRQLIDPSMYLLLFLSDFLCYWLFICSFLQLVSTKNTPISH